MSSNLFPQPSDATTTPTNTDTTTGTTAALTRNYPGRYGLHGIYATCVDCGCAYRGPGGARRCYACQTGFDADKRRRGIA